MKAGNFTLAVFVATLLLSACGSSDPVGDGTEASSVQLRALGSDAKFYAALRAGLKAQISQVTHSVSEGVDNVSLASMSNEVTPGGDVADSAISEATAASSSGNDVSSTNVQEHNVDELDWVKIDSSGELLYLLQGTYADDNEIRPLDESVSLANGLALTARTSIAAPASYKTKLRVMGLDVRTPDSTVISEFDVELSGRYAEGFYLYESAENTSAVISATGSNYRAYWSTPTAFSGVDSLISKVDLKNPASPSVASTFQFDGQIIASRRIDNNLFFASRYYPTLPGDEPWRQSPEVWAAQVDSADLAEALPLYRRNGESEGTPLIDPAHCFVAQAQESMGNYTPDIITLAVLDLDTMDLVNTQCFLGATETLYASADAVFLATTDFSHSHDIWLAENLGEDGTTDSDESSVVPADKTHIHQFDINEGSLMYVGTGTVKGHLGWNPLRKSFRMSEKDGYLRVATFNDDQRVGASPILLTVLLANGQGNLEAVATLPNSREPALIGKPGEQLYASRFLGDRAYLVTFRQTDPLYIIDLADPVNPRIAGELEIEGYSDYLLPIGQDYLLGIGKDAVAANDGVGDGRGALVQGVKLSLFNVSSPASPTEVQSMLIGQRGTHSNALFDHRAITVQPATDVHPTRISLGIDVYGNPSPERVLDANSVSRYHEFNYSGLHGFEVKVGADAQIIPKGVLLENSDRQNDVVAYGIDRSVMVNDALFYITDMGVSAANWEDLGNPSAPR